MDLSFKKAIIKAVDRIRVAKCNVVIYRTKYGYISSLKNDTFGQYNYILKIEGKNINMYDIEGKKMYTELLEKPKAKVDVKKKPPKDKDISDMQETSGN